MGQTTSQCEIAGYGTAPKEALAALNSYLVFHFAIELSKDDKGKYFATTIDGTKHYVIYYRKNGKYRCVLE